MFLIGEKAQAPFATVWNVEGKGKYVQGRISTSEKDQEGNYINSNWFARFVGKCKDNALDLNERDRIKILSGKITNIVGGEGENKKSYLNVVIFDFELLNPNGASYSKPQENYEEIDEDEIPFK